MLSVCLATQSCLTLCNIMDCSLPGSPVHGILQAKILEWVAFPTPGFLLTQGSKPYLLNLLPWQVDSLPLSHLGSPIMTVQEEEACSPKPWPEDFPFTLKADPWCYGVTCYVLSLQNPHVEALSPCTSEHNYLETETLKM